ncbi:hypothetical protein CapIbe_018542 [Capra ibex]
MWAVDDSLSFPPSTPHKSCLLRSACQVSRLWRTLSTEEMLESIPGLLLTSQASSDHHGQLIIADTVLLILTSIL